MKLIILSVTINLFRVPQVEPDLLTMRFSFRDLDSGADIDPGVLRLIPRNGALSGIRAFALLASEHGLEGFVHGREPTETIELPSEPTLDDMLAAEILALKIAGQDYPAGMRAFTQYARFSRDGLRPKESK